MQVEQFLEQSAARSPDKTALIFGDHRLTYRDLNERANRLAHALRDLGVRRGDRVAIYLDNSVEAVLAMFAILKAGGVFLVVNHTTKPHKLAYVLNDSGSRALFAHGKHIGRVHEIVDDTPALETVVVVGDSAAPEGRSAKRFESLRGLLDAHAGNSHPVPKECIDIDLAALIYTSGSTGNPKGVAVTHLNVVAAATSITTYLENVRDDIILNVLPLSFDYGLYQILMGFKIGGTVVLEPGFVFPHAILQKIVKEKVSGFPVVPTIAAILLQLDLTAYDLSALRYISSTGAVFPADHIAKLRKFLPNVRFYSMFGLTECKRVSYLPPEQLDKRPTSVGKAMPNVEVYVVDEHGNRLPPGQVGELVVRGSNVMTGYWGLSEETDKMLRPGPFPGERVLYTGDLFRMDDEGFLYFESRKDDIIKTRGEKVSPKEVENVLHGLEGVAMAAVIGVPDKVLGSAVKAFVSLTEGSVLTRDEILRHCKRNLEELFVPKFLEIRENLPRTSSGKIDKRALGLEVGQES